MKTLTVDIFDSASIAAALAEIDALKQKLDVSFIKDTVVKQVAEIGLNTAREGFESAMSVPWYGDDSLVVSLMETPNGYCICAMGEQVSFIEFGAGVYSNATPYPGEVPDWVVPWGEYGWKKGRDKSWTYINNQGVRRTTEGIMARQGMYYALQDMIEATPKIFKGWFEYSEEW